MAVTTQCVIRGDGSQADPWRLSSEFDFDCFDPSSITIWTLPNGATTAYFVQTEDLVRTIATPVLSQQSFQRLDYDGQGHSVTIENVAGYGGLFGDTASAYIRNLTVHSDNSSLATGKGWFAGQDESSTFANVSSTGPIPANGGGIVGMTTRTVIESASSTGAIGVRAGGIAGRYASRANISNSISTGTIGNGGGGILGSTAGISTVTGSSSSGSIGPSGGGIVGSGASRATVSASFSTGSIGGTGGGIIGSAADTSTVTGSYSVGIIGDYGGGIVGSSATLSTVSDSFSTGLIGFGAGGIVGDLSTGVTVSKSYSTGLIGDSAGGIVGVFRDSPTIVNSYSLGSLGSNAGGDIGPGNGIFAISNVYLLQGNPWSDVQAQMNLTGYGTTWGSCGVNRPWFLLSFYPDGVCDTPLDVRVIYDGTSPPPTAITVPPNDQFSLENKGASGPFSWVSIVNGTGSVKVGGTTCTTSSACKLPDMVQDNTSSQMVFTIVSAGTVTVRRHVAGVSGTTVVGTFTVTPNTPPEAPAPPTEQSQEQAAPTPGSSASSGGPGVAPSVGASSPAAAAGKSAPTLKRGKKMRRPVLLSLAELKMSKGESFELRIKKASRRRCLAAGSAVKARLVGRCTVTVSVVPTKGRARSRTIPIDIIP
jgi:hypothetical protein